MLQVHIMTAQVLGYIRALAAKAFLSATGSAWIDTIRLACRRSSQIQRRQNQKINKKKKKNLLCKRAVIWLALVWP